MWIDKRKAKGHRRRVSEKVLFFFPLLGGSVGGLVGMYLFHHKTRHWYFRVGFPLIMAAQAALAFCAFYFCGKGASAMHMSFRAVGLM